MVTIDKQKTLYNQGKPAVRRKTPMMVGKENYFLKGFTL